MSQGRSGASVVRDVTGVSMSYSVRGGGSFSVLLVSVRADHGGGPRHVERLLRHLPDDVEAHVACPNEPPYYDRFRQLTQGRVLEIPHRRFQLRSALNLAAHVRRHGIDVIHTHGKGAGPYGRLVSIWTGHPCLHTPHGMHVGEYGALSRRLYRLYENVSSHWVDRVICVSQEECAAARAEGLWPSTPSIVIPNGVEDVAQERTQLLRRTARQNLGIQEGSVAVVTVSRFDFAKNMQEAFRIAKAMPDLVFLWGGEGEDMEELKRRAEVEGVGNLRFLGSLDDPDSVLAASDIYLTTSRWEGLPFVVLEAMAMGVPVVASDVVGHHDLVGQSEAGLLYPLGEPDRAVTQLRRLADDNALRQRMGECGRDVQRAGYSARKMASAVCDLYRELAEGRD